MLHVDPIFAATSALPAAVLAAVPAGPSALAAGGEATPPPFTVGRVLTETRLDSWLALSLVLAAGLYLYGVYRLRLRGDGWPISRTVFFLGPGLGGIALVTVSGLHAYDTALLSVHMIQHMVLSMVAPIFLALGAPMTLALRTLPVRARKRLLAIVHSRVARVYSFPLVAFAIFVVNPFALYFSDLYRLTLEHAWAHELVHAHFIMTGCVFFWPLLGLDPLPGRWPYPARALLMLLSVPFHTVLGLTIMQSTTLFGGDWYPSLNLGWADPWEDQVLAGGILWAGGEFVSVTMLAVLVVQWVKQSEREARRVDRELDRQEARDRAAGTPA
ncbi:cytochrome c oxidase assembly protein [Micromonospora acroterricola]|uniref:Cytochrome c oxidase assembly protein n=1 Tax=Micromonospora acroterricola TaxID=2202421 RepID=A0A317CSJ5_9ACTN|nr:cytochrome c oxidase assembly protein [Micromonospora acroterricola]PWR05449.1 cytochrome c oxidase assembly protein [Micromonospora acroterricola]